METTKLQILKASLAKKEAAFNDKLQQHFDTVKQANGQPLNDKRNGHATLNKWDKQNSSLHTLEESIQKTKKAIEVEEGKIQDVTASKELLPSEILKLIESGDLIQWRKHPHTFFVAGVEKARICWDKKKKVVAHKFFSSITDKEQRAKFVKKFNELHSSLNCTN